MLLEEFLLRAAATSVVAVPLGWIVQEALGRWRERRSRPERVATLLRKRG